MHVTQCMPLCQSSVDVALQRASLIDFMNNIASSHVKCIHFAPVVFAYTFGHSGGGGRGGQGISVWGFVCVCVR